MKKKGLARRLVKAPIRFYRKVISPLKPATCRFYPTCSAYALEAVEVHGALKGSWLAMRRIARCHPFNPGGIDLVPPRKGGSGTEEPEAKEDNRDNKP